MKTITKIFIALVLGVVFALGAFPNIAHADEVVLTPSDSIGCQETINGTDYFHSPKVVTVSQDKLASCPSREYWKKGTALQDVRTFYAVAGSNESTGNQQYCNLYQTEYFKGFYDFSLDVDTCVISLDVSNLMVGMYRYECDIYFGMSFAGVNYSTTNLSLNPTYTYSSAPVALSDGNGFTHGMLYLVGETTNVTRCSDSGALNTIESRLVQVHLESTFTVSQGDTLFEWDVSAGLPYLFGSFQYDLSSARAINNSYNLQAYFCNRYNSVLYGNVEPPVTPTPTVTPYPGQDTQESINQGVQSIIQGLDVQATPIPHPDDLTIDETIFDALDDMTLPDVTPAQSTFTNLWSIFNPLWAFVGLFAGSMTLVGIFMYCLKGRFI